MTFSIRRDAPALLILILLFAASLWAWPQAPDRIPTHWGIDGNPDAWGGKGVGLFLLPGVAAASWALMFVLPKFDPGRANYASFAGAFGVLRTAIVAFLALIHGAAIAAALGRPVNMGHVAAPATGLLFIVMGGMLAKVRPNWFVGVRTPWTLSSKLSWTRTHRAMGWLFVASGVVTLIAGLLSPTAGFVALIAGALGSTVFSYVYSYRVWKSDPDRQAPGGTTPA